jgi:type III restriction enzyme
VTNKQKLELTWIGKENRPRLEPRILNELKPVLGLELTATPYVESGREQVDFKNIIFNYRLASAMADGFVKEPAVVTRKNFNPMGMSTEEIERLKLEDGVRLHESVKVDLETYARDTDNPIVKPFLLVIARDTTHAAQLMQLIQSDGFFKGYYKDKVIQVDSSRTGAEEEAMIERLLKVEHRDEPTEIVIHVNMLKEGWDVTNLYTIVPLRAANAKVLIEQSIGRGLRLPYGRRTGVTAVDRLNIVAHDKFQEIIDEANRPGSAIQLQKVELSEDQLERKTVTVVSQSQLASKLGLLPEQLTSATAIAGSGEPPLFAKPEEQKVAQIAYQVIRKLENRPDKVPTLAYLQDPAIQAAIVKEVEEQYRPSQLDLEGVTQKPDIAAIVEKTATEMSDRMIAIPRIQVFPKSEIKSGFKSFTLELSALTLQAPSDELWVQHLRTNQLEIIGLFKGGIEEDRLEDYIVSGLVDFDDISYDDHADLLYDLAGQTVRHFQTYLSEEDTSKVLRFHQRRIADFVHAQMQGHYWEDEGVDYQVTVRAGFTELKRRSYTQTAGEPQIDFRQQPPDLSHIDRYLFKGFARCLYTEEKFQSDTERRLAVILDRETEKWFKPAKGQFQIFYKSGADYPEYQPDFVAETKDCIYLLESKAKNQMEDPIVLTKKDVAVKWCAHASAHAAACGGKPWKYALVPHDAIAENMTLAGLVGGLE